MARATRNPARNTRNTDLTPAKTASPATQDIPEGRTQTLLDRAEHGDVKAMHEIRQLAAKVPDWEREYYGPATIARRHLLEAVLGENLLAREAWERRAQALQKELAGPAPTPLERTLCERIASCWLDAHLADLTFAAKLQQGMTVAASEYFQRRQDRAQARYLAAVTALARVRRLLAPVVAQVNIAEPGAQQLNLAPPGTVIAVPPVHASEGAPSLTA